MIASSYFFDRLVRERWGAAARWATLWFAAGVVTLLAEGQLHLRSGGRLRARRAALPPARPLQVGAARRGRVRALEPGRRRLPGGRRFGRLGGSGGAKSTDVALWVAALALVLIVVPNLAFPEPGQFPFSLSSYLAIPLWCGAALYVTRGVAAEERQLRWVLTGYLLAATLLWLVPNPLGGNAVRLGALFGGPVLAAVVLARRPPASLIVVALALAGGLYWQVTASVSQIVRSVQ